MLLISNEASELVKGEAGSASVAVADNAVNCVNVWVDDRGMCAIVGKRFGRNVGGVLAMWVPVKIWSKIRISAIVDISRKAGGSRGCWTVFG